MEYSSDGGAFEGVMSRNANMDTDSILDVFEDTLSEGINDYSEFIRTAGRKLMDPEYAGKSNNCNVDTDAYSKALVAVKRGLSGEKISLPESQQEKVGSLYETVRDDEIDVERASRIGEQIDQKYDVESSPEGFTDNVVMEDEEEDVMVLE